MEPILIAVVSFLFNALLGTGMFFMKVSQSNNAERLGKVEERIDHIRDNYIKKEDFREFKDELWGYWIR